MLISKIKHFILRLPI